MEHMHDLTLVTVSEFAEYLGISRQAVNDLRRNGIIPWFGRNPVRIPFEAACSAIVEHAARNAAAMAAKEVRDDAEEA